MHFMLLCNLLLAIDLLSVILQSLFVLVLLVFPIEEHLKMLDTIQFFNKLENY